MSILILRKLGKFVVYALALIGAALLLGYIGLRFGWTNTAGRVDFNDRYFKKASEEIKKIDGSNLSDGQAPFVNECKMLVINKLYPATGRGIIEAYSLATSSKTLAKMVSAAEIFLQHDSAYVEKVNMCLDLNDRLALLKTSPSQSGPYSWMADEEWLVLKQAIVKDKDSINQAGSVSGVPPRLIVAMLVGEQLRLFNSEREVYKQVFAPLKILGVQSKFSWGVMGIKEETAKDVEENLASTTSVFYLGPEYRGAINYPAGFDHDALRFERLTDGHNHYYSYLYGGLLLKQIMVQWQKSGFDISYRPEILATLFNLGFDKSRPNGNPQVGGAAINVGGQDYSFGSLAFQFYYSGELAKEFPLD